MNADTGIAATLESTSLCVSMSHVLLVLRYSAYSGVSSALCLQVRYDCSSRRAHRIGQAETPRLGPVSAAARPASLSGPGQPGPRWRSEVGPDAIVHPHQRFHSRTCRCQQLSSCFLQKAEEAL